MTWVTLGVTGAAQQVVGPEDTSDFRVSRRYTFTRNR
jgi:hypothetical protein